MNLSPTGFSGCLAVGGSRHRIGSWYGTSSKCLSPRAVLWEAGTFQLWRHWLCLWLVGPAPHRWSLLLFGLILSSSHLEYLILRWLSYNQEVNWSASTHSTSPMRVAGISSFEDRCSVYFLRNSQTMICCDPVSWIHHVTSECISGHLQPPPLLVVIQWLGEDPGWDDLVRWRMWMIIDDCGW